MTFGAACAPHSAPFSSGRNGRHGSFGNSAAITAREIHDVTAIGLRGKSELQTAATPADVKRLDERFTRAICSFEKPPSFPALFPPLAKLPPPLHPHP